MTEMEYLPKMPKGFSDTWSTEWYRDKYNEAVLNYKLRASWLNDNKIPFEGDQELRDLDRLKWLWRSYYLEYHIDALAKAQRARNHKTLAKQYGKAGETIRILKLELFYLRSKASEEYAESLYELKKQLDSAK